MSFKLPAVTGAPRAVSCRGGLLVLLVAVTVLLAGTPPASPSSTGHAMAFKFAIGGPTTMTEERDNASATQLERVSRMRALHGRTRLARQQRYIKLVVRP